MKRNGFAFFTLLAAAATLLAGCQGGACSNCGAGYGGYPTTGFPPQNGYAAPPPGTYGAPPQSGYIQPPPGTVMPQGFSGQQPGVIVPQQVAPMQSPPGTVYGSINQ